MNIVFLSIGGLKDLGENAVYPDLLRYFRDKGHSVYIVCQRERRSKMPTEMLIEHGMKVLRVKTGNITKTNLIEKGISTLMIGTQFKRSINKYFADTKFDLVLYSTPPITISNTVSFLKKRDKAFTYLMLKDIFPQNALDIELLKSTGWKGLVTRYFFAKEKKLYLLSDAIGCMSDANVRFLIKNNSYLSASKIEVCPNTINPIEQLEKNKINIRNKFNLPKDKMIFVYGGNFGKPQDVEFIIDILKKNEKRANCHFVMCGSGTDFYKIKKYEENADKNYITVLDSLNKQDYDSLLDACDVGLLFLDHRFTIPNFPSRLLDYMNHELPVLAATDSNTDVGEVITKGNFGWWSESNNIDNYCDILDKIISNPAMIKEKGISGRKYLDENYHTRVAYDRIKKTYDNGKSRAEEKLHV
ncbi:MAG: glycosyltransferase family 4 protein [Mobilitalea sp.]